MSNQIEQIPAKNEQEIAEIAELAPSCDFCHYSDLIEREEWCKEKFRHFFVAGMLAERERMMKDAVECEIGWSDGYRIAPASEKSMNEALAKIGVLDQVGAGVDAKVSVTIIKKEK